MTTICIDCRYIGNGPSGIGEMVEALIRYAPDLAPDLDFLLLRSMHRQERLSDAVNVSEISVKSAANGPATMWWLPQVVDFSEVNLFHATFNILPARLKMPTLTTVHDIMWLEHPEWCNPRLYGLVERRFYQHGIRRAFDKSDHIATVSTATRNAILRLRPDLEKRSSVTLSGVSPRFRSSPIAPETLRRIGLPEGRRFVLTAGQYAPYKNHEGVIKAFADAFGSQEDVDLILVQRRRGGAEALVALCQELGIEGRVHFSGTVSEEVLIQLYSSASVLLHPSFCEGFGNPLAEAMACGCPVITSNCSAMPEVTAGAALLVDPHDISQISAALKKVIMDKECASRMRDAGRVRADQLSWRAFTEENVAIYRRLLAAGA